MGLLYISMFYGKMNKFICIIWMYDIYLKWYVEIIFIEFDV